MSLALLPGMQLPLQITFRDFRPSAALRAAVERRASRLERYCDALISCRVTLGEERKAHRHGRRFICRIDAKVPGREVVAGGHFSARLEEGHERERGDQEDAYVVIRDAFDELERGLLAWRRVRRGPAAARRRARSEGTRRRAPRTPEAEDDQSQTST